MKFDQILTAEFATSMLFKLAQSFEQGKHYRIQVTEHKGRTLSQNALFHLWCHEIAKQWEAKGWSPDVPDMEPYELVKLWLKDKFRGPKDIEIANGVVVKSVPWESSKADKADMCDFMTQVEAYCAERGWRITIPMECEYRELLQRQVA